MTVSTDRIEKQIVLRSPHERVWRALSDAREFGEWFGMVVEGAFAPDTTVRGRITTPGFEHLTFDLYIERVEPETLLSYRWHPYAVDPAVDYSREQRTLVTFTLEDAAGGTLLKVTETGFDQVPPGRRMEAFRMNSAGWDGQIRNIQRHVGAR